MTTNTYPAFTIPGAHGEVKRICRETLRALYGEKPPAQIPERLEAELALADRGNFSSVCLLLHRLGVRVREHGGQLGVRGTLGATLISFLLGITDIHPLRAHYCCPRCGYGSFAPGESGYDLPRKACPDCGTLLRGDGHNIPYEACTELIRGRPIASVNIHVAPSAWETAVDFLVEYVGRERIACAGEWNEPVCFLLAPEGVRVEAVTPVAERTSPVCCVDKQTLLPGYELPPALLRVVLLPYEEYDRIHRLHHLTGTTPEDIDYSDPGIYQLFQRLDTRDIPVFSAQRSKQILKTIRDVQFSDLIRVGGMACGTDAWENNGEQLLHSHSFRELIATRDDVFLTLRKYSISRKTAEAVMERVRSGKFCADTAQNPQTASRLLQAGVPGWYVESMQKVRYLFPKAHAAQYAKVAATLAWFRVYAPAAFFYVSQADLESGEHGDDCVWQQTAAR